MCSCHRPRHGGRRNDDVLGTGSGVLVYISINKRNIARTAHRSRHYREQARRARMPSDRTRETCIDHSAPIPIDLYYFEVEIFDAVRRCGDFASCTVNGTHRHRTLLVRGAPTIRWQYLAPLLKRYNQTQLMLYKKYNYSLFKVYGRVSLFVCLFFTILFIQTEYKQQHAFVPIDQYVLICLD